MSVHDDMSDSEVLRTAADVLSAMPVAGPPDAGAVMARGRARRRRHRATLGLASTTAAAAVAISLAAGLGGSPAPDPGPAPSRPPRSRWWRRRTARSR